MKKTLMLSVSALGFVVGALPGVARADSISDLSMQMKIIESQIRTLQAHSSTLSSSSLAQLREVQEEVAQMKAQLAEVKAQPPVPPAPSAPVVTAKAAAGAYPYPGLPPAPANSGVQVNGGTGPTGPKVLKPLVGGILLYAGNGSALFIDGTIDGGIRYDTGVGHSNVAVQSGLARTSRLALEGYQNIGFGLRAVGVIEGGLDIAEGLGASNPSPAGKAFDFGRESYVGIGNDKFGYIDFGRQYAPIWAAAASPTADPFGGNFLGGIVALDPTLAVNSRVSNSIVYNYNYTWEGMIDPAPSHGFGFAAMFTPAGNHPTSPTTTTAAFPPNAGQQFGAMASYGTKRFFIDGAFNQIDGINTNNGEAPFTNTYIPVEPLDKTTLNEFTFAGSYVTPIGRLFAQYDTQYDGRKNAADDGVDQYDWFVGLAAPTFPHQVLRFTYGTLYNKTSTKAQYSVAQASYEYDLVQVPGSSLYIEGALIDNNKNSAQGLLGATDVGGPTTGPESADDILPTQLTGNGTKLDYGATASTIAMGVRFIF
jgi:predicted porin